MPPSLPPLPPACTHDDDDDDGEHSASQLVEWGCFELQAVVAASLGPVPLAAHGVFATTASFLYIAPAAIGLAAATMAGSALGAARPRDAKQYVKVRSMRSAPHPLPKRGASV